MNNSEGSRLRAAPPHEQKHAKVYKMSEGGKKAHIHEMWERRKQEGRNGKATHFNSCLFSHEAKAAAAALSRSPSAPASAFGGLGRSTFSFGRQTVLARGADGRRGRVSGSRRREREREKRGHPSPRPKRARKTNGCNRTELMWWKGQIPLREELRK